MSSAEANRLKRIFRAAEKTAARSHNFTWTEARKKNESKRLRKKFEKATEKDIYKEIVAVTFFAGFNAVTVENRLNHIYKHFGDPKKAAGYTEKDIKRILKDKYIIRNERRVRGCRDNAIKMLDLAKKHESVKKWIFGFGAFYNDARLPGLIKALKKFNYLGKRTVYHPLTDWGFPVVKPDRMVTRVLYRLGLVPSEGDSERNIGEVQTTCRKFARLTGYSIRYVDYVFVSIGQVGAADICRDNQPRCDLCYLKPYCGYPRYN